MEHTEITARTAARLVEFLVAHGLDVPAELAEAVEVRDLALRHLTKPPDVENNLYAATPKTVVKVVDAILDAQVRASARQGATSAVDHALGRRIIGAVARCAPVILDALAPVFNGRVVEFTDAYSAIRGASLDSDSLVTAGPEAVAAFHKATTCATHLDELAKVRRSLEPHVALTSRRPGLVTAAALVVLETDDDPAVVNNLMGAHGPCEPWAGLVRAGGQLRWATVAEQRATVQRLDDPEPQAKRPPVDILKRAIIPTLPETIGA